MKNANKVVSNPKEGNLLNAFNRLNEALRAFGGALGSMNTSVKNFHHLAEECTKYKL